MSAQRTQQFQLRNSINHLEGPKNKNKMMSPLDSDDFRCSLHTILVTTIAETIGSHRSALCMDVYLNKYPLQSVLIQLLVWTHFLSARIGSRRSI